MCGVPAALAGLSIAATGYQAYTERKANKLNAQLAEQNARIAQIKADDARNRGQVAADRVRAQAGQDMATQRTAFAGNNVRVDQGSAASIVADTAYIGELDAMTIENNAAREAFGFESDAFNSEFEADRYDTMADMQPTATLLAGAGRAGSLYYSASSR